MKRHILTAAFACAIICAMAATMNAFMKKDNTSKTDTQCHVLTSLWKEYDAAVQADLPKKALKALETIKSEAKASRLPWDFYDAATQYVSAASARNWKLRESLLDSLNAEVEAFDEPIVTYAHRRSRGRQDLTDYVIANKERLQAMRNPGFHSSFYLEGTMTNVIRDGFKDDYEYALWNEAAHFENWNPQGKAVEALKEVVGDAYPASQYIEYKTLSSAKPYNERTSLCKTLSEKYVGKAISLIFDDAVLAAKRDSLRSHDGTSEDYKSLLNDCQNLEKKRKSFRTGVDSKIAGSSSDYSFAFLAEELQSKDLMLALEDDTISVMFRNLDAATLTLTPDAKGDVNAKPIFTKSVKNATRSFYVWDTVKVCMPKCDDGDYVLTAKNGNATTMERYTPKRLSIALRDDCEALRFYVTDYMTGKPVETVDLTLYRSGKQVTKVEGIPMDGFTAMPPEITKSDKKNVASYVVATCRDSEGYLRMSEEKYLDGHQTLTKDSFQSNVEFNIFTDKSAYNPGETIHFKAVLYKGHPTTGFNVLPKGKKVSAELLNSEGKSLTTIDLTTNEYGAVAGDLLIPEGERNGRFTLVIKTDDEVASKSIVVDEFVLPSFDVEFDPVDGVFFQGDTITISGKVTSYSGHPLSAADVTYKVYSGSTNISSGDVTLEEGGSFKIAFDTQKNRYSYTLIVRVVDATGETLEFSRNVFVVNHLSVEAVLHGSAEAQVNQKRSSDWRETRTITSDKAELSFIVRNSEGEQVAVPVDYEIASPEGETIYRGTSASGEKNTFTLAKSGLYKIKYSVTLKPTVVDVDTDPSVLNVLRIDEDATALEANVESLFLLLGAGADGELKNGEDIHVKVGAGDGPLWMAVGLFGDKRQPLDAKVLHLEGKQGEAGSVTDLVWNYRDDYPDALFLSIFYFRNGTYETYSKSFKREKEVRTLPLSFSSFRDSNLPGAKCSIVLDSDPDVEAVAAVFDKSSETVASNFWRLVSVYGRSAEAVHISAQPGSIGSYSYYNKGVVVGYGTSKGGIKRKLSRSMAMSMDASDGIMADNMVVEEAMLASPAPAPMLSDEMEEVEDVDVRSDFSTSLAFEPFLRPDKDGKITLDFKTSDKLSTYIVQVYAHTKDMDNATVRQEMVVTVPVKVSVVEPKYIYEGDKLVLHASVSNSSDIPVSGKVSLQVYPSADYSSTKPVSTLTSKVTIPAGGASEVSFDVASRKCDTLGLKVVFADAAKTFSDGVFVTVPVLEAQQTLTESHSAVLLSGMDEKKLLAQIRAAFTGTTSFGAEYKETNILQMVEDAIPSKVDPSGKDVLSLSEAFYVRKVAAMLGSSVTGELSDAALYSKIMDCRNADGGFGWFEGMKSSPSITAVVLERMAKLRDKGLLNEEFDPETSVAYLDRTQFLHGESFPFWCGWLNSAQYMFVRSLYASVPFDVDIQTRSEQKEFKENYKSFKEYAASYLVPSKKDGRGLNGLILAKARRLRTLANLVNEEGGVALASAWGIKFAATSKMNKSISADAASLLEYAVEHPDGGIYYPDAVMPWRGLLESEAYAHSMICDMFSDARVFEGSDTEAEKVANGIRLWLMLQKETQKWGDDPAFVDAVNSVLSGPQSILDTKVISLTKTYRKPIKDIVAAGNDMTIERTFYKSVTGEDGKVSLVQIQPGTVLHVGDKVTCKYNVWSQENRSFVKLSASREAAFRPVNQLSGHYGWWMGCIYNDGRYSITPQGYRNVKAAVTEYFFDVYPEDKTTVTEELFVTQEGKFVAPVVAIESLYAPHYRANDAFNGVIETAK